MEGSAEHRRERLYLLGSGERIDAQAHSWRRCLDRRQAVADTKPGELEELGMRTMEAAGGIVADMGCS